MTAVTYTQIYIRDIKRSVPVHLFFFSSEMSQATAAPSLATEYRKWPSKPEARKLPGATMASHSHAKSTIFWWYLLGVTVVNGILTMLVILEGMVLFVTGWQDMLALKKYRHTYCKTGKFTYYLGNFLLWNLQKRCDFKSWGKASMESRKANETMAKWNAAKASSQETWQDRQDDPAKTPSHRYLGTEMKRNAKRHGKIIRNKWDNWRRSWLPNTGPKALNQP